MGNWTNRVYSYFESMETSNKLYELRQNDKIRYPNRQFDEDDGVANDNYERAATTVRFDSDVLNREQPRKGSGEAIQKKRKMSSLGWFNHFNNKSNNLVFYCFVFKVVLTDFNKAKDSLNEHEKISSICEKVSRLTSSFDYIVLACHHFYLNNGFIFTFIYFLFFNKYHQLFFVRL